MTPLVGSVPPLDPTAAALSASGPVLAVLWLLGTAAVLVWVVIVVKARQLVRWTRAERELQRAVGARPTPYSADEVIHRHPDALGAYVLRAVTGERGDPDFLEAVADRTIGEIRHRASAWMTVLATIGSAAPFVGLFGTVWGILDAFLSIGHEQSVSLAVVAPAIGEALFATAVGLVAAIPAVVGFNFLSRRLEVLLQLLSASGRVWARALSEG